MKVKDLVQFLQNEANQEADLILTINGHYYAPLGIAMQGFKNPETNYVGSKNENGHTEFGLYLMGADINIADGEVEPEEIVAFDPKLFPGITRKI